MAAKLPHQAEGLSEPPPTPKSPDGAMDWDDVRYFLAVARRGTVRAAAHDLKVNHSTVLRRIAQLEKRLGALMFERLPSGYRPTPAGREALSFAEEMEASSIRLQGRVLGRDQSVRGPLRVSLPPVLASHLLMADLTEFALHHPEIELELMSLDEPVNLTKREADVAIRNVYDQKKLPDNLHGAKGPDVFWSVYLSRNLLERWQAGELQQLRWIVKDRYGHPAWSHHCDIPTSEVLFRTNDAGSQLAAARQGLGMTLLPCFVGDAEPMLARAPGAAVKQHGTLWVLSQGETRKTLRVRLFTDFVGKRLAKRRAQLAGAPSHDPARGEPRIV